MALIVQVVKDIACGWILIYVGSYIYRSADLSGAAIATLSFYRNNQILARYMAQVELQVSGDGGATWTTLQSYSSANLVGSGIDTFDISDYASPNTQIRFYVTSIIKTPFTIFISTISRSNMRLPAPIVSAVHADQVNSDWAVM